MRNLPERLRPFIARLRTTAKGPHFKLVLASAFVLLLIPPFFTACGGSSGSANVAPPPVPAIQNINDTTDPSSPVSLPIEINGSGFQSAPGTVVFTQTSSGITATVTPNSGGWTDAGIAVTVPTGNGTNNFTLPGTVTVTVKTSGGTSNAETLTLIQTLSFQVNNVQWAQTTALPVALTGLRAVAVPVNDTSAYAVVTGGYDGTTSSNGNTSNVYVGPIDTTGVISGWNPDPSAIPETIADHVMVEANPENSLVSAKGPDYIYVIGGQVSSTDAAGGTADVYYASFDPTGGGAVGTWAQTTALPEPLVGAAGTLYNGYVYVVGGLHPDGTPSSDVFSAKVKSDGTLDTWTKSTSAYPTPVSFATAFGFAGKLYVLGGDPGNSTDPNAEGTATGITNTNFAPVLNGVVGTWTATAPTIKNRKKQITWTAFGQVIDAEGIYNGLPGSLELEHSQINPNSTLATWTGITASVNQIGDNVYNAAAFVSPLQSPTSTPRFILLGGEAYTGTSTLGVIKSNVYYNTAP